MLKILEGDVMQDSYPFNQQAHFNANITKEKVKRAIETCINNLPNELLKLPSLISILRNLFFHLLGTQFGSL